MQSLICHLPILTKLFLILVVLCETRDYKRVIGAVAGWILATVQFWVIQGCALWQKFSNVMMMLSFPMLLHIC